MKREYATCAFLREELERQYGTIREMGYPEASGTAYDQDHDGTFRSLFRAFVDHAMPKLLDGKERKDVAIPVLLVIPDRIVPLAKQMRMTRIFGKPGELGNGVIYDILECGSSDPSPLPYVLLDVQIGVGDVRREGRGSLDGLELDRIVAGQGRFSMTAAEGVALATHFPEFMPGGAVLTGTRLEPMAVASIHGVEPWRHFDDQPYGLGRAAYGYNVFGNTRIAHCAGRLVRPPPKRDC